MNIKNAEAHALAKELAELEHTTVTEAVVISLRESLAKRRMEERRARRLETMRQISEAFAEDLRRNPVAPSLWEICDDLYDDMGLPK